MRIALKVVCRAGTVTATFSNRDLPQGVPNLSTSMEFLLFETMSYRNLCSVRVLKRRYPFNFCGG